MPRPSNRHPCPRHMRPRVALLALLASSALGCGGGAPASEAPVGEQAPPEPPPPPPVRGDIHRADLLPILDAGLGRFLQGVEITPHLEDGRFVGFRLVSLWPQDSRFQGIDLGPGDVVVRVNGQPIERPEQAQQVWNSLRVASALLIEYLRDGEPHELRFAIVD